MLCAGFGETSVSETIPASPVRMRLAVTQGWIPGFGGGMVPANSG